MKRLTKKKLQDALLLLGMIEVRKAEALPDVAWEKSEEYITAKEKLLHNLYDTPPRPVFTPKKFVAAILVAIFLLAVTACAAIEPIREFFIEVFDEYIRVEVDNPDASENKEEVLPKTIEVAYSITNIPDGFVLVDDSRSIISIASFWINDDGSVLIFEQNTLEGNEITMDGDNAEYGEIIIEGRTVFRLYSDGMYVLMWKEHGYLFSISCSDTIPWETVVDMVTGLAPEE